MITPALVLAGLGLGALLIPPPAGIVTALALLGASAILLAYPRF